VDVIHAASLVYSRRGREVTWLFQTACQALIRRYADWNDESLANHVREGWIWVTAPLCSYWWCHWPMTSLLSAAFSPSTINSSLWVFLRKPMLCFPSAIKIFWSALFVVLFPVSSSPQFIKYYYKSATHLKSGHILISDSGESKSSRNCDEKWTQLGSSWANTERIK